MNIFSSITIKNNGVVLEHFHPGALEAFEVLTDRYELERAKREEEEQEEYDRQRHQLGLNMLKIWNHDKDPPARRIPGIMRSNVRNPCLAKEPVKFSRIIGRETYLQFARKYNIEIGSKTMGDLAVEIYNYEKKQSKRIKGGGLYFWVTEKASVKDFFS